MVGMTVLIIIFHILYFSFGSRKVPVKISASKNDHQKTTELRLKEDCQDCYHTVDQRLGTAFVKPIGKSTSF
jgi:hypothetical protein